MERWEQEEKEQPIVERVIVCESCKRERQFKVPINSYKLLMRCGVGMPRVCEKCFRAGKHPTTIKLRPIGVAIDE